MTTKIAIVKKKKTKPRVVAKLRNFAFFLPATSRDILIYKILDGLLHRLYLKIVADCPLFIILLRLPEAYKRKDNKKPPVAQDGKKDLIPTAKIQPRQGKTPRRQPVCRIRLSATLFSGSRRSNLHRNRSSGSRPIRRKCNDLLPDPAACRIFYIFLRP
jgi:hypothetical protein